MDDYAPATLLDVSLFFVFLCVFLGGYYRTVLSPTGRPDGFGNSSVISNLHSVPLCALAFLSLNHIIPETVPICWSVSFFVVDLIDSIVRREAMWFVHAVISLALNLLTGSSARHRALRSVSKGFFAEASTRQVSQTLSAIVFFTTKTTTTFQPFLNHWKKSKSYSSYVVFFVVFTLCRLIWVPYFIYTTYFYHLNGELDMLIWPSLAFCLLQFAWYAKMCMIAVNYKIPKDLMEQFSKEQ
ncbi:hypothetical protein ACHAXA_009106 [Cyclostephanos tholiformis]